MSDALQMMVQRMARLPVPVQERFARRFMRELDNALQTNKDSSHTAPIVEAETTTVRFEDIEHLLGVFDGPDDLSTNKTYLDDLGKRSRP